MSFLIQLSDKQDRSIPFFYPLTILLSPLFMAQLVQAQEELASPLPQVLSPITVVASRLPQPEKEVIGDVTIISREELKKYQGESVIAALRSVPNMQIANSGGPGKQTSLYLRGTNSNQVAIFIDGVRYESATTGVAALEHIPAEQLERVEILQGAAAGLYGADAIGGVIQLFTRNGLKPEGHLTVGGGNETTFQANTGYQTGIRDNRFGKGQASINYAYFNTHGINATNEKLPYYNPLSDDHDGYRNNSLSLNALQSFNDKTRAGLGGLLTKNRTEYDPLNSESHGYNGAGQIFVAHRLSPHIDTQLKYGLTVDDLKSMNVSDYGTQDAKYKTMQHQLSALASYQNLYRFGTLAFDQLRQHLDSDQEYTLTSRTLNSISLGGGDKWRQLGWQANVRHDHSDQFKGKTTFRLGMNYDLNRDWQFGASYGTGYRIPTFNDLYYPASAYYVANPNLVPETSRNVEASLRFMRPDYQVKGVIYRNRLSDMIQYISNPATYIGTMENVGKANIRGASLLFDGSKQPDWLSILMLPRLTYGSHIDYVHAEDVTGSEPLALPRRAKYTGLAYIGLKDTKWNARAEMQAVGKRFDDAYNLNNLPGYAIANLYGSYHINGNLSVGLRLNNLFNTHYTEVLGYNTAGINGLLSLSYNWR